MILGEREYREALAELFKLPDIARAGAGTALAAAVRPSAR